MLKQIRLQFKELRAIHKSVINNTNTYMFSKDTYVYRSTIYVEDIKHCCFVGFA